MFDKENIKIFFWIFGLIFTVCLYLLIMKLSIFDYIKEAFWKPLLISLVTLILFFCIGIVLSKKPMALFGFTIKQKDLSSIETIIAESQRDEKVRELVKRFRKVINIINIHEYSEKSIEILMNVVGLSEEQSKKVIGVCFKLRKVKTFLLILAAVLPFLVYYMIVTLSFFSNLNAVPIVPVVISLTVFLLFVLEATLVTRLPDSFYVNLVGLNKEEIDKNKVKLAEKASKLQDLEIKKAKNKATIKQIIIYLLSQEVAIGTIREVVSKYGLSEPEIITLFKECKINTINSIEKKDARVIDLLVKLSLANIHDNFLELKQSYDAVNNIQLEIDNLSKKQDVLSLLSEKDTSKLNKYVGKNKKGQSFDNAEKILSKIDTAGIRQDMPYNDQINFIYHLLLPQVSSYSKEEITSVLLYEGYTYEFIDDVFEKLIADKVQIGKNEDSKSNGFINFINKVYDLFSK